MPDAELTQALVDLAGAVDRAWNALDQHMRLDGCPSLHHVLELADLERIEISVAWSRAILDEEAKA